MAHRPFCTANPALITGGGTGIGRGIALALARRGVPLVIVGRRAAPLEAVMHEARALGVHAVALPGDITSAAERTRLVHTTRIVCGQIGLLVHSSGLLGGGGLLSLDEETLARTVATNLVAPIDLTRLMIPDLVATGGAVVLIGSTMSHVPMPYASLYSATKAGVAAFGASLRYELAPLGVHVLTACPPGTDTAMVYGMAQRAGLGAVPLAAPEAVGERIVQALEADKRELVWGAGERLLVRLYCFAPRLVQRVLATQRTRFQRMFSTTDVDRG